MLMEQTRICYDLITLCYIRFEMHSLCFFWKVNKEIKKIEPMLYENMTLECFSTADFSLMLF